MAAIEEISTFIKTNAAALGFDTCGFAKVECLQNEENHLKTWLNKGFGASMNYMHNHFDMRLNPALLVDGAKSVVSLLISYNNNYTQSAAAPKIARYALGNDYHKIIRKKLNTLLKLVQEKFQNIDGRVFVDSAPVLERAWAVRAGLGWIGKSTAFISPEFGSFVFISELILNVELIYDAPFDRNPCGACNRCIANCPNSAIEEPHVLNAQKCISFQTIENKGEITEPTHGWLFGCDRCLQVCPYNKRAKICHHAEFAPINEILNMSVEDWQNIDEEKFNVVFKNSPLMRTKFEGVKRNLQNIVKSED